MAVAETPPPAYLVTLACSPEWLTAQAGAVERQAVLAAIQEACNHRAWTLLAAHVRTTHVHVVVEADRDAEFVMGALKSYASRALNRLAPGGVWRRRWDRHGSARRLWTNWEVLAAIHYVVREQGEPMTVFEMAPLVTETTR